MITFEAPDALVQQGLYTLSYSRTYFILLHSYFNRDDAFTTMEFVLGDAVLSFIGRIYLHLLFRNKEKVQQELIRKYEGQFRNVGTVLLADAFMALTVVAAVSLIATVLYFVIS